jgi:hypothetical protein
MLKSVARVECANGSLGLAEANGSWSSDIDATLANSRAAGVDVAEHALAGANLLDEEMQLAAVTTKRSPVYSITDNEVESRMKRFIGVSCVKANSKNGRLASKHFLAKCSTCGEVLPVEPLSRQVFHVAVKLQEQEEKIGSPLGGCSRH